MMIKGHHSQRSYSAKSPLIFLYQMVEDNELLLTATLRRQWMRRRRKWEIHTHRQDQKINFWDADLRINTESISALFIPSYSESLATFFIWFAHFSQNMHIKNMHHKKKKSQGSCPDLNNLFHVKTASHLPHMLFVSKPYVSPRREHQKHPQPF